MTKYIVLITAALVGVFASVSATFAADAAELSDLGARVQFAYYAADARALTQGVQALAKLQVDDSLSRARLYALAYGQWKLAETLQPKDSSGARRAAQSCIDATDQVVDAVPKRGNIARPDVLHAEALAIQAACASLHGDLFGVGALLGMNKSLETARSLQPSNPRVLLVAATIAIARAKSPKELSEAERMTTAAVAAFDVQPPQSADAPDWGSAEALARLGAMQLQQGNRVAARDSIEHALVLASDYVWARELLRKITGR
jgi:hypothetical protein